MLILTIEETSSLHARRTGVTKEFKSVEAAKRYATKSQAFHGTVLNVFDNVGSLLFFKLNGQWITVQESEYSSC